MSETVQDVLRDMRQWKGDYSVFADRIEQSLSAGASGGGDDAVHPVNHAEALELAIMRQTSSNLARCYIDLHVKATAPASPATGQESRAPGNQAHCSKCDYFYPRDGVCMCYAGRSDATPPAHGDGEGESRESRMVVIRRDASGTPTVWCDPEIVDLVSALNAGGLPTVASCSGHGERHGNIALADGRELLVAPDYDTARAMDATLLARPAPEADARDAQNAKRYLWLRDDASRAQLEIFADRRSTRLAADRVCDAGIAMSLPAQGREGEDG